MGVETETYTSLGKENAVKVVNEFIKCFNEIENDLPDSISIEDLIDLLESRVRFSVSLTTHLTVMLLTHYALFYGLEGFELKKSNEGNVLLTRTLVPQENQ